MGGYLFVGQKHIDIFENCFHPLRIGDEIGRDVAAVNLHALDILGLKGEPGLALFDGNHAVFADLVHHVREQRTNLGIGRRIGSHVRDVFLALDLLGHPFDGFHQSDGALFDTAFHQHRVRAGPPRS